MLFAGQAVLKLIGPRRVFATQSIPGPFRTPHVSKFLFATQHIPGPFRTPHVSIFDFATQHIPSPFRTPHVSLFDHSPVSSATSMHSQVDAHARERRFGTL